jgi:hypothetical protein
MVRGRARLLTGNPDLGDDPELATIQEVIMEPWNISVSVTMTQKEVIDFAYLTKETIEAARGHWLYFEQGNCHRSCFNAIKEILGRLDPSYLERHKTVKEFFDTSFETGRS